MDIEDKIERLAGSVAGLQAQINSFRDGMTPDERKELTDAKADLAELKKSVEVFRLAMTKALTNTINTTLAGIQADTRNLVDHKIKRAAELTGEALGTFQGDARAYADEAVQDASIVFRRESEKARNAADANTAAAVSFVRRSLHRWCA